MSTSDRPVVYGFEVEDVQQENALGRLQAQAIHPENPVRAYFRGRCRTGRWKKQEYEYARFKESLRIQVYSERPKDDLTAFNAALVHEILDLLPLAQKEETLKAMIDDDGRVLTRVGRQVRDTLGLKPDAQSD